MLGHRDRARDVALNMMRFFEHESCGFCTPCRVGTAVNARLIAIRSSVMCRPMSPDASGPLWATVVRTFHSGSVSPGSSR